MTFLLFYWDYKGAPSENSRKSCAEGRVLGLVRFVIRKMLHNKLLIICLLIGVVLAVGMVSSIPMFADGILNRMLVKDLEGYQSRSRTFTGRYYVKCNLDTAYKPESRLNALHYFDQNIPMNIKELGVPILGEMTIYTISAFRTSKTEENEERAIRHTFRVAATDGFFSEKANITHGTAPSATVGEDGVIEVAMSYANMVENEWELGRVYEAIDGHDRLDGLPLYFKIVGVFELSDPSDAAWYDGGNQVMYQMMMDYGLFRNLFVGSETTFISAMEYYYAIDYHSIKISNLQRVYGTLMEHEEWIVSKRSCSYRIPIIALLEQYGPREEQLRTMLLVIQIPILLMLAFYTFMLSQLILDYERNEISLLKSRGASRWQIVLIYLLESAIIGAVAMPLGIGLGVGICKLIGASNGFLEFVSRAAIYIEITPTVIFYALITVLFSVLTMVMPAIGHSKIGIVEHKTKSARKKTLLWKKLGLDFVLLGLSGYGLYTYNRRMLTMAVTGMDANAVPIDPLLFVMSTLFIIGAGLLFVRIYPYLVRLVFQIGKKAWSPVMYASFLQVARSGGQEAFLMLFLVMTLSTGLFSANAARTLNTNITDRVQYALGADIVVKPYWRSNEVIIVDDEGGTSQAPFMGGFANDRIITYIEPDFSPYYSIEGVESVARVFTKPQVTASIGTKNTSASMMAVNSADFGRTAFMPERLLPFHWYEYLNLMTLEKKACLISTEFATEFGISVGDTIRMSWERQSPMELRVYGIVDYWPTYKPLPTQRGQYSQATRLIICNLDYVRALSALEPYEVWMKKADDATSEQIYGSIRELGIAIEGLEDSSLDIVSVKNDPLIQGVNGALTMGFLVTMVVCSIGFIIYWVLSIKRRVLQFGILRAMGLSMGNVTGMLVTEQLLISGSAILMGVFTGAKASELFVPLLQVVYKASELIPPFRIIMERADYLKVYMIIGVMLLIAFFVLGWLISKIKMAQALKLGED
jgi:putative ABC transport system permease protein